MPSYLLSLLLATLIVAGVLTVPTAADPSIDPSVSLLIPVAQIDGGGEIGDTAVHGSLALLLLNPTLPTNTPRVLDLSDPTAPREVARLPAGAQHVALQGTNGFVLGGIGTGTGPTFSVFDLQQPDNPRLLSSVPLPAYGTGLVVQGTVAYVSTDVELLMYGLTDPLQPSLLGRVVVTPIVSATPVDTLRVIGTNAYLATGTISNASITQVNVADPHQPFIVGSIPLPTGVRSFDVIGTRMVVAGDSAGLSILDTSVPAAPVLLGTLPTTGQWQAVRMVGDSAYLVDNDGLRVIDLSDPTRLVVRGQLALGSDMNRIVVAGSRAYIGGSALTIVDIAQPSAPALVGMYALPGAAAVQVVGSIAYVAGSRSSGLTIFDLQDPTRPIALARLRLAGDASVIRISDGRAYIGLGIDGLQIVDVANPRQASVLGVYHSTGIVQDLQVVGIRVYLAASDFQILDVSDPAAPTVRWTYPQSPTDQYRPSAVRVSGGYAYVAAGSAFSVFAIDQPGVPRLVGELRAASPFDTFTTVELVDTLAYVGGEATMASLTRSAAVQPFPIGQPSTTSVIRAVDIHNPAAPTVIGRIHDVPPWGRRFHLRAARSGLLLVNAPDGGPLGILDLHGPATIWHTDTVVGCPGGQVALQGNRVYVADWALCIHELRQGKRWAFLPVIQVSR